MLIDPSESAMSGDRWPGYDLASENFACRAFPHHLMVSFALTCAASSNGIRLRLSVYILAVTALSLYRQDMTLSLTLFESYDPLSVAIELLAPVPGSRFGLGCEAF